MFSSNLYTSTSTRNRRRSGARAPFATRVVRSKQRTRPATASAPAGRVA